MQVTEAEDYAAGFIGVQRQDINDNVRAVFELAGDRIANIQIAIITCNNLFGDIFPSAS